MKLTQTVSRLIEAGNPKIQMSYMILSELAKRSAGSSSDPKSLYAAVDQIAASQGLSVREAKRIYEIVAMYKRAQSDEDKDELETEYKKIVGMDDSDDSGGVDPEMKPWLEEAFDKYNDLMDLMVKINVRDEDVKKEWAKVDKAFDSILKIYKKKYAKD